MSELGRPESNACPSALSGLHTPTLSCSFVAAQLHLRSRLQKAANHYLTSIQTFPPAAGFAMQGRCTPPRETSSSATRMPG